MGAVTLPADGREIVSFRDASEVSQVETRAGLPPIAKAMWTWLW
jgi:hypothetical protein